MFRYRKNFIRYRHKLDISTCPFCERIDTAQVLEETAHTRIMKNVYGYDVWEMRSVTDHLMVLPKRHVAGFADLNTNERLEIIEQISKYQTNGYNIYARSLGSNLLTVPAHQHTHLIKISPRRSLFVFALTKPYLLVKVGGKG